MLIRYGNGAGWGRVLPSPSPYPILIYLPVTLSIPNGDEKLNPIPVPDGFGYPRPIPFPALNNFFNKKYKFFLHPQEQRCNTLSNNKLTFTFVRQNYLVDPLNINGSFY
ncbi:hypothetical protein MTR_4g082170 [Medicago truncatula]|uniref:Uncharacterized protein n=1 Tax=Medicago truncatula TaxID=3880 RepID=G7JGA1_MEDTR|nr:hypothetical protein MTR_4g082170 [Medicago truncatula]